MALTPWPGVRPVCTSPHPLRSRAVGLGPRSGFISLTSRLRFNCPSLLRRGRWSPTGPQRGPERTPLATPSKLLPSAALTPDLPPAPPRCLRLSSQGGPTLRILGPRREPQPQASPPRAASSLPTASLHFRWGRGSLRAQLSEIRKPPSGKGGLRLGKGRTGLAQVRPWAGRSGHAALRPPPALTEGRPRLPHSILRPLLGARVPPRGGPTDPRHVIHVACSNWPA